MLPSPSCDLRLGEMLPSPSRDLRLGEGWEGVSAARKSAHCSQILPLLRLLC